MWTAGIVIIPNPETDHEGSAVRNLEIAGWQIPGKSTGDRAKVAYGEFSTLSEYLAALNAAEAAPAEIQPLSYLNLVDPNRPTEGHYSTLGDVFNLPSRKGATDGADANKTATTTEKPATGTSAPPAFPDALWSKLTREEASKEAALVLNKWLEFVTDRKEQAAWAPSREATLLAHLQNDSARAQAAAELLAQAKTEAGERVNLMKETLEMSVAIRKQFSAWTRLAKSVPLLLGGSILLSSVFVLFSMVLVDRQRINGLELSLLAFIFALTAISPATLLLVGRPLAGLDVWTPDAMFKAGKKDPATAEADKAATKTDTSTDEASGTKDGADTTPTAKP